MARISRGDVVVAGIDQGPNLPIKRRPVVVVQGNHNNARLGSAIVAMITSNTRLARREPTQVLVDVTTADGNQTGLSHTSAVKCENLYTKLQSDMRKIGVMPPALMQRVDAALKASLDLP
jgi:mRNA-degrading endonuclease toxin of MazEF toxin-antitoxin module